MYGCNVLFRPLCMAVMPYSDDYVWLYVLCLIQTLMYGSNVLFRPLCMAVMSSVQTEPYVWQ